jgi:hypothetical protein
MAHALHNSLLGESVRGCLEGVRTEAADGNHSGKNEQESIDHTICGNAKDQAALRNLLARVLQEFGA